MDKITIVGIDLGERLFQIYVVDLDGKNLLRKKQNGTKFYRSLLVFHHA
jgi:hypothetical protein